MYNKIRTHPGPLIPDIVKSFSKSIKFLERSYVPTDSLIQSHQSNYFAWPFSNNYNHYSVVEHFMSIPDGFLRLAFAVLNSI